MLRLRVPVALVAVFVLVALVVGVLVGGRLMQDWNAFRNSAPADGGSQSTLAELEAKPLSLPVLKPGDPCPFSPGNTLGYDYGAGPVYAMGGQESLSPWGYYFDVTWITARDLTGPVLIRGGDLMSSRKVAFVGAYSAGAVVGTDTQSGKKITQRGEILLDAGKPNARESNGYGEFPVHQGLSLGWVGCGGFQIDGPGWTETITAFVAP